MAVRTQQPHAAGPARQTNQIVLLWRSVTGTCPVRCDAGSALSKADRLETAGELDPSPVTLSGNQSARALHSRCVTQIGRLKSTRAGVSDVCTLDSHSSPN